MWVDSGAASIAVTKALFGLISLILIVILFIIIAVHLFRKRKGKVMNKPMAISGIIISSLMLFIGISFIQMDVQFLQNQLARLDEPTSVMIRPYLKKWIEQAPPFIIMDSVFAIIFGILPTWYFCKQYRICKSEKTQ